jgi:hypothetical protein
MNFARPASIAFVMVMHAHEDEAMSSTAPPERPKNPTHFGGNDLSDSANAGDQTTLKVQLGEHLDSATRRSLQVAQRSSRSASDFLTRNPIPLLIALGGLVWLIAARSRRSTQRPLGVA